MRPTLGEGEESVGLAVKVPSSIKAAIETAAAGAGMSASTWLRRAIDVALESEVGAREAKLEDDLREARAQVAKLDRWREDLDARLDARLIGVADKIRAQLAACARVRR